MSHEDNTLSRDSAVGLATATVFRIMTDEQYPASSYVPSVESILRLAPSGFDREDLLLRLSKLQR